MTWRFEYDIVLISRPQIIQSLSSVQLLVLREEGAEIHKSEYVKNSVIIVKKKLGKRNDGKTSMFFLSEGDKLCKTKCKTKTWIFFLYEKLEDRKKLDVKKKDLFY